MTIMRHCWRIYFSLPEFFWDSKNILVIFNRRMRWLKLYHMSSNHWDKIWISYHKVFTGIQWYFFFCSNLLHSYKYCQPLIGELVLWYRPHHACIEYCYLYRILLLKTCSTYRRNPLDCTKPALKVKLRACNFNFYSVYSLFSYIWSRSV